MVYRRRPRGQRMRFARSLTRESKPLASTVPYSVVVPSARVMRARSMTRVAPRTIAVAAPWASRSRRPSEAALPPEITATRMPASRRRAAARIAAPVWAPERAAGLVRSTTSMSSFRSGGRTRPGRPRPQ